MKLRLLRYPTISGIAHRCLYKICNLRTVHGRWCKDSWTMHQFVKSALTIAWMSPIYWLRYTNAFPRYTAVIRSCIPCYTQRSTVEEIWWIMAFQLIIRWPWPICAAQNGEILRPSVASSGRMVTSISVYIPIPRCAFASSKSAPLLA